MDVYNGTYMATGTMCYIHPTAQIHPWLIVLSEKRKSTNIKRFMHMLFSKLKTHAHRKKPATDFVRYLYLEIEYTNRQWLDRTLTQDMQQPPQETKPLSMLISPRSQLAVSFL